MPLAVFEDSEVRQQLGTTRLALSLGHPCRGERLYDLRSKTGSLPANIGLTWHQLNPSLLMGLASRREIQMTFDVGKLDWGDSAAHGGVFRS